MVNNILGYQNRAGMNNLLQQSSANLTNQMMPQINMPNPLLGMDLSPPPPTPPSFYDKIRSGAMDTASGLAGAFLPLVHLFYLAHHAHLFLLALAYLKVC